MTNRCACGNDKEDWMEVCKKCFAQKKSQSEIKTSGNGRDTDIHRQVFLKISSEQVKGTPDKLVAYAKQLEANCKGWL
jgi:hypothetical protein